MRVAFRLEKILREFELADTSVTRKGNHVFDAVAMDPAGHATHFTRRIMSFEEPWTGSVIVMNDTRVIGSGEDPRPFYWSGSPCISAVTFSPDHGYINKIYIQAQDRWLPVIFRDGKSGGKNWMPFVRDDDLFFVHEFSPFRILKAEYIHENDGFLVARTVAEHKVRLPRSHDKYPWLRGGSNAVQIGRVILGMGHTNEQPGKTFADIRHRPFLFVYRPGESLDYLTMEYPFDEAFRIIDPTSLYIRDGMLFLITSETERAWSVAPQKGRTCLYSIDISAEPDESGFGFRGRRLHRWTSGQDAQGRGVLGAWRRHKGA